MENKEEMIAQIELSRRRMHKAIDEKFDELLATVQTGNMTKTFITQYDLGDPPFLFKGKKPIAINYPNGEKVYTKTWREVAMELLNDCNSDPVRHKKLMYLRNAISGRSRTILSDTDEGMNFPMKIDDNLYFEGKFDTEFLIKVLTQYIFEQTDYPYSNIEIEVRESGQKVVEEPVKFIDPLRNKFGDEWVTSCYDKGIERQNPQTLETEICEGYYCQVYSDEYFEDETDNFCLAVGHEIKDLTEEELTRGIIEYLGLEENAMTMKM